MPPLFAPGEALAIPLQAAERLVREGDGDGALLYLALLHSGGDGERAMGALNWEPRRVIAAGDRLARLELVRPEQLPRPPVQPAKKGDELPAYTRADIVAALEREADFKSLYRAVESCLGRTMSDTDMRSLYTLYDYLALPHEVILILTHWCAMETERRLGPGKRPRMPEIKKEGFRWHRLGMVTPELAEAYLQEQQAVTSWEREILPLLDIRDRAAVPKEREYLEKWAPLGFDNDAIQKAYETTIFRIHTFKWSYMHKILMDWHAKGLHTVAQIEAGDAPPDTPPRPGRTQAPAPGDNYQPSSQRIQENADWLDKFLEQQKKGG